MHRKALLTFFVAAGGPAQSAARPVVLSNIALPRVVTGAPMRTGEVKVLSNVERDGHYYLFMTHHGGCEQVNCCLTNGSWPGNGCWDCCPAKKVSCIYSHNHTAIAYRTRDFVSWEDLGVVLPVSARAPGLMFQPAVVYHAATRKYVMWFENYNATDVPKPGNFSQQGHYSVAVSSRPSGPYEVVLDGPANSARFACSQSQGDFDLFVDDDGSAYIVLTHYTSVCIERLNADFLGGTGETTSLTTLDPLIPGGIPGDEAPVMFKRDGVYYVMYGSGCCACKGGSNVWVYASPAPLGPYAPPARRRWFGPGRCAGDEVTAPLGVPAPGRRWDTARLARQQLGPRLGRCGYPRGRRSALLVAAPLLGERLRPRAAVAGRRHRRRRVGSSRP